MSSVLRFRAWYLVATTAGKRSVVDLISFSPGFGARSLATAVGIRWVVGSVDLM